MMMDNTITAIIPVREGSRRLKNKNIAYLLYLKIFCLDLPHISNKI